MVWSQYVYEAHAGLDTYASDDDEHRDDTPLTIDDWEVKYSDELWMMWNTVRTLLHDMYLDNTLLARCRFTDFVAFCYADHDSVMEHQDTQYEDETLYIWKSIRRVINANDLHEEMMRGANYHQFVQFVTEHTDKKYLPIVNAP